MKKSEYGSPTRIKENTKNRIAIIQGQMQIEQGKKVTPDEVINLALDRIENKKIFSVDDVLKMIEEEYHNIWDDNAFSALDALKERVNKCDNISKILNEIKKEATA